MSFQDCLTLSQYLIALVVIQQSLEQLYLNKAFEKGGWAWTTVRQDLRFKSLGLDFIFSRILPNPFFSVLRIIAAILLCLFPHWGISLFLFLSTYLLVTRWRGNFNGGSDHMSLILLGGLFVAHFFSGSIVAVGAFLYIGLQSVLSYFIGGWIKILRKNWRQGLALKQFILQSSYGSSQLKKVLTKNNLALKAGSWVAMIFEMSAPLALFFPSYLPPYLAMAFCFHLLNFYIFGLNRFVFVWVATYPAFAFTSLYVNSGIS